jgi:hypothetical protein
MSFPTNAGLLFLKDEIWKDSFLVDTGATLSIVPHNSNESPSIPILNGANGKPIPTWGLISKVLQFQGYSFKHSFLQATVAGPILGIDFLKQFNVTVATGSNKILFATTHGATCPNRCYSEKTPFTAAAKLKGNPGISPTNANSKTRSLLDPPLLFCLQLSLKKTQPIPASVPADVKALLEKYPTILCTGDGAQTNPWGGAHHSHGRTSPVFAKARCLEPAKLEVAKKEFQKLETAVIIR